MNGQSNDADAVVARLIPAVTDFLRRLPPQLHRAFDTVWAQVRLELRSQHESLERARGAHAQRPKNEDEPEPSEIPRPDTSNSVHDARTRVQDELASNCAEAPVSDEVATLIAIPTEWARDILARSRKAALDNDIGCWFCIVKPTKGSYTRMNLRNTEHPTRPGRKIGQNVYRHRLAIVAKGEGSYSALASREPSGRLAPYHASHLCHNAGCFRPEHLVVEPAELNTARNECQGQSILVLPGGAVIHLYPHWDWHGTKGHR
ncbi:hypothetical protein ACHAPE_007823, partial [Trichoderma viride]